VIWQPQRRPLCRFKELAAILVVFFALPGITQVNQNVHNVKIVIANDVSLDNVDAEYVLFGSFGNQERSVRAKPDQRFVEVNPFVNGILAEKLKIFIWVPGCEIRTFDVAIPQDPAVQQAFTCKPLGTVRLTGQVIDMDLLRPAEIQVEYFANWGCQFFELENCVVPAFPIGTAKMDGQGIFQIDLPDFARDPTLAKATPDFIRDPPWPNATDGAAFQFTLEQLKPTHRIVHLQPKEYELQWEGDGLTPATSYPQPVLFIQDENIEPEEIRDEYSNWDNPLHSARGQRAEHPGDRGVGLSESLDFQQFSGFWAGS